MSLIYVKYFGDFEIRKDGIPVIKIKSRKNRVKKLLGLIMISNDKIYSDKQLVERIWQDEELDNQEKDLTKLVYLARKTLRSIDENLDFIIREEGKYVWNPDILYESDARELEVFNQKIINSNLSDEEKIEIGRKGVELYEGELAANFEYATWCLPMSEYYNNIFLEIADEVCGLLESQGTDEGYEEIIAIGAKAKKFNVYNDKFYLYIFKALKALNRRQQIIDYYDELNKYYFKKTGEALSDDIKKIYAWAIRSEDMTFTDIDELTESLRERSKDNVIRGAYYCEREMFKHMAHFILRNSMRNNHEIVVMLITIFDEKESMSVEERDKEMDILEEAIRKSLRKDDVFSRYSVNQFLIMPFECKSEHINIIETRITNNFEKARSNPDLGAEIVNFKMEEDGYELIY